MVFHVFRIVLLEILAMLLTAQADKHEQKLIRALLDTYDTRLRPNKNALQVLNVTFGLALAQLIDVVRFLSIIHPNTGLVL